MNGEHRSAFETVGKPFALAANDCFPPILLKKQPVSGAERDDLNTAQTPFLSGFSCLLRCGKALVEILLPGDDRFKSALHREMGSCIRASIGTTRGNHRSGRICTPAAFLISLIMWHSERGILIFMMCARETRQPKKKIEVACLWEDPTTATRRRQNASPLSCVGKPRTSIF